MCYLVTGCVKLKYQINKYSMTSLIRNLIKLSSIFNIFLSKICMYISEAPCTFRSVHLLQTLVPNYYVLLRLLALVAASVNVIIPVTRTFRQKSQYHVGCLHLMTTVIERCLYHHHHPQQYCAVVTHQLHRCFSIESVCTARSASHKCIYSSRNGSLRIIAVPA